MDIEELVGMLGLNLPRVIGVNIITEGIKNELVAMGVWQSIRGFGFVIPLVVAIAFCWFCGERMMGAIRCGLVYGVAAIALHEFDART